MADDVPRLARPEVFWGKIMHMVRERADTATLWEDIRRQAAQDGLRLPRTILTDVARMRSAAVKLRTASEILSKAQGSDTITSAMMGRTIYARDLSSPEIVPQWHVRFSVPVTTSEGTEDRWYMMQYQGTYPQTVDQLMGDLEAYASALAGSYGAEFGSVGSVELGVY